MCRVRTRLRAGRRVPQHRRGHRRLHRHMCGRPVMQIGFRTVHVFNMYVQILSLHLFSTRTFNWDPIIMVLYKHSQSRLTRAHRSLLSRQPVSTGPCRRQPPALHSADRQTEAHDELLLESGAIDLVARIRDGPDQCFSHIRRYAAKVTLRAAGGMESSEDGGDPASHADETTLSPLDKMRTGGGMWDIGMLLFKSTALRPSLMIT